MLKVKVNRFPQKFRKFYSLESGLESLEIRQVIFNKSLFVVTPKGIYSKEGNKFVKKYRLQDTCSIHFDGEKLLACTNRGVYHVEVGDRIIDEPSVKIVGSSGKYWILGFENLIKYDRGKTFLIKYPEDFEVRDLVEGLGGLWIASNKGLFLYNPSKNSWKKYDNSNSRLLSNNVRTLVIDYANHLWIGTDKGVNIFAGNWMYSLTGDIGLPYDDITTITLAKNGTLWIGTTWGAIRLKNGRWSYFASLRWLPNDYVTSITIDDENHVWIGTKGGLSEIWEKLMTLSEKAKIFEEKIGKYHYREGYVNPIVLEKPGDLSKWHHRITDNDGLWTALYVAAECFSYAVTGEEEARKRAVKSFEALERLSKVTGIKGFPARAIAKRGADRGSGGEWHPIPGTDYEWKGDTSSDEIVGHIFAYTVFYQLIDDPELKKRAANVVKEIVEHIIEHGLYLIDLDGKPTMWGFWAPEELNENPLRWEERGLNSLEILAFLKAAYKMTGDEKFEKVYRELIEKHHYALNTIEQKINIPCFINHSDDELAFLSYYVLLTFEDDPTLRRIYLLSLERSWRIERPERNPLWNFIYGALTGNDCDAENAVRTLIEIPLDTIEWTIVNSHRKDITINKETLKCGEIESTEIVPYDERRVMRWNGNPYRLDGGSGGREILDGTHWLLPYWMGRYYGFIEEE
ncbi:MAG TPA: transcriptional regulator [Thermoproteales archaeon]|nr:transcriptional regulator [Thermoproteales archaeon]